MTLEKAHERGTHLTCAKACFSWSSNVAANLKTSRNLALNSRQFLLFDHCLFISIGIILLRIEKKLSFLFSTTILTTRTDW